MSWFDRPLGPYQPGRRNDINEMYWPSTHARTAGLLWLGLLFLPIGVVWGQNARPPALSSEKALTQYVYQTWTMADGLPHGRITCVAQTQDGYLWIGTLKGLVRFDGVKITVLDPPSLPGFSDYAIETLYVDRAGVLWIGTLQNGALRYKDGAFKAFDPQEGFPHRDVYAFYDKEDGALYAGVNEGLIRFTEEGFVPVVPTTAPLPDGVKSIISDGEGGLWLGHMQAGLSHLRSDGTIATFARTDNRLYNHINTLYRAGDGTLWMGTDSGLLTYSGGTFKVVDALKGQTIRTIAPIQDAGLWIGSYRGGLTRILGEEQITTLTQADGLFDERLLDILQDREGNVWIATAGGLIRVYDGPITTYTVQEGLPHDDVRAVYEDRSGAVWVATWGGLARFKDGAITTYTTADGLASNVVHALWEDRQGILWIGTENGIHSMKNGTITPVPGMAAVSQGKIQAIYQDLAGQLWFGTRLAGLFSLEEDHLTHYGARRGIDNPDVRVIHEDQQGRLWVGTTTRLLRRKGDHFVAFPEGVIGYFRTIYEEADGTLWFGTRKPGLYRYAANQIRLFTSEDGLYDSDAWQILEDDAGSLWMCSDRGLYRVEKAVLDAYAKGEVGTITQEVFGLDDGMKSVECNGSSRPSGWKTRDGQLWFATQQGVVVVDPGQRSSDLVPPVVVIEQVVVGDSTLHVTPANHVLHLSASQRDFEIGFTATSLRNPSVVRLQHFLEGYDRDWRGPHTRREASYTNLPPGTYTFRVRASNNETNWMEAEAALTLTVSPFFYETWWFLALCGLGIMLLGAAGYRVRLQQLRQREAALEQLVNERTEELRLEKHKTEVQASKLVALDQAKNRFFANITHEFRTPLTLIIGPLKSALAGAYGPTAESLKEAHQMMLRNSQRLLRFINQILDLAKAEAGHLALDAHPNDLAAFTKQTVLAFAPLADRQRIRLTCELAEAPVVVMFDPIQLEKVLLNLLSNALKFTESGGEVAVLLRQGEENAEISVRDSGIGIPSEKLPHLFDRFYQADVSDTRSHEGTGIGLALAKELVELHHGTLTAESKPGRGSTFTVRLPRVGMDDPWIPVAEGTVPAELQGLPAERADESVSREPLEMEPYERFGDGTGNMLDGAQVLVDRDTLSEWHPTSNIENPKSEIDQTTILIVDDNADVRNFVRSILATDYRVLEAADGEEGLHQAKEALPDLIVSDVMMPRMNGFGLNRALKEDPSTDCIPVILLTARADTEGELTGFETGADDYVTKPFEAEVLRARIAGLIATRLRLRERFSQERLAPDVPEPARSAFEQSLYEIVEVHLTNPDFNPEALADGAALSYSQLYRRMRDDLQTSPTQFIRRVRVERAAVLLIEQAGTISEIAYAVGFNSLSYFNRSFREHFDVAPSAYLSSNA